MKKVYCGAILCLLTSLSSFTFGQETQKLYYDENGKGLDTKKGAAFYRQVSFDQNNNPVGEVLDFYLNGKPMTSGRATIIDKFDDTKSRWKGPVIRYNEKGKEKFQYTYNESGLLNGTQYTLTDDGKTAEEMEYLNGNPAKDFYIVYDKKGNTQRYSYLTRLPMKLATTDKVIVPITDRKIIYQDGLPVQFYFIDGLTVAVKISTKQLYGDYYEAFVTIENGTKDQFNFDPTNITSSLEKDGEVTEGIVLSYADYIKKVNRRQKWTAAFTAFAETAAATSAGYSSTTTNAYVRGSNGSVASGTARTTSYNGAAQYAATQNASNNMSQLANNQYNIKQTISEGYLKLNTIFPDSRLVGFVNIKLKDADHILLNVPVNGKIYHFEL